MLILLLGLIAVLAIDLAFAPWIYVVGGRVRLLPVWAGTGVAHAPSGPYTIFLWFSPTPSGSHILPSASIQGGGWVCTPQRHRYTLRVIGGASGRIWNDMDGHSLQIYAYHKPFAWRYRREDRRPSLSFSGKWVGPNLALSDDGSIAREFQKDGNLKSYRDSLQPSTGVVPLVLTEASWWATAGGCPTAPVP